MRAETLEIGDFGGVAPQQTTIAALCTVFW
jgi:hypothetical protein